MNISTLIQLQNTSFCTVDIFITAVYDNDWWLGYTMEISQENGKFHIRFLHLHGPLQSFTEPAQPKEYLNKTHVVCLLLHLKLEELTGGLRQKAIMHHSYQSDIKINILKM
jgi:hypothetical protein